MSYLYAEKKEKKRWIFPDLRAVSWDDEMDDGDLCMTVPCSACLVATGYNVVTTGISWLGL